MKPGERDKASPRAVVVFALWVVAIAVFALSALSSACGEGRLPGYFTPPQLGPTTYEAELAAGPDAAGGATSDVQDPGPDGSQYEGESEGEPSPSDDLVPSFAPLFRRLSPSVVNIYTQEIVERQGPLPWSLALEPEEQGSFGTSLGSGMVLDVAGHILTNAHVVENAAEIRVRFHDESELPARLIGLDPVRDLAVLKVDGARSLVPVVRGDSDRVDVGDWVVAIGNPLGLTHTMTKGIVSGKGRSELSNERLGYLDLLQTDAAINQGSSGGPLFDLSGRVVGVNTALTAEGHGIGFAIGWNAVEEALPRLMQGGQVSRSWLGVYVRQEGEGLGQRVTVSGIVDMSPASKAGLQPGDVVHAMDERPVKSVAEFRLRVASAVAGRDMRIDVERRGLPLQLIARLEEAPNIR